MRLKGKTAIVTGGGAGIGEAIALAFGREGARVVIADRDASRGEAVAGAVQRMGGDSLFGLCDVGSTDSVTEMVATTVSRLGKPEILVNNPAIQLIGQDSRVHDVSENAWDRTMNVNLKGTWRCMRSVIPHMLGQGGSIVNIASPTGMLGVAPGYSAYSSSKGGVFGLSRVAAAEYARDGIRVNAVVPGTTITPLIEDMLNDDATRRSLEAKSPMGRLGTPADVAGIAVFLASDEASYCTGGVYMADGGMTAV